MSCICTPIHVCDCQIIVSEGKDSPLIVFLRGADRLALAHFDRLSRLERIERQEGMRHVVIACHATEAKKEKVN